jgi:hypothetical protein
VHRACLDPLHAQLSPNEGYSAWGLNVTGGGRGGVAVQVGLSAGFVGLGPRALVFGNAGGMLVRILGCWSPVFSEVLKNRKFEYFSLGLGGVATCVILALGLSQAARVSAVLAVAAAALLAPARRIVLEF